MPRRGKTERTVQIIEALSTNSTQAEIARTFGVTPAAISAIWRSYCAKDGQRRTRQRRPPSDPLELWRYRRIAMCVHSKEIFLKQAENKRRRHVFYTGNSYKSRQQWKRMAAEMERQIKTLTAMGQVDIQKEMAKQS